MQPSFPQRSVCTHAWPETHTLTHSHTHTYNAFTAHFSLHYVVVSNGCIVQRERTTVCLGVQMYCEHCAVHIPCVYCECIVCVLQRIYPNIGSYSNTGLQATVDVVLMYAIRLSLNVDTDSLLETFKAQQYMLNGDLSSDWALFYETLAASSPLSEVLLLIYDCQSSPNLVILRQNSRQFKEIVRKPTKLHVPLRRDWFSS